MCVGPSMMPTFGTAGDIVLVEHMTPRLRRLKRGDVVIAQSPTNPKQTICKRITGLGGDTISVAKRYPFEGDRVIKVPEGKLWLEGDNPRNSTDSRSYGPVPYGLVRGKVFFKLWPLTDMGRIKKRKRESATR